MDNDELKRRFGRKVQALREQCGFTQEQLAERIGRTVHTIGNIERGTNSTRVETAAKLASALGVTLPELFELTENHASLTRRRRQAVNRIAARLEALDDGTFEATIRLIDGALDLSKRG